MLLSFSFDFLISNLLRLLDYNKAIYWVILYYISFCAQSMLAPCHYYEQKEIFTIQGLGWQILASFKPRNRKLHNPNTSSSLLGTLTSPQYINWRSLSKCTGDTSLRKTMGVWSGDLLNRGGWRVSMDLNRGLQALSTSLWASKTRSPHQTVTSVSSSCCRRSSARAKKLTPWSFHLRIKNFVATLYFVFTSGI